MSQQIQSFSRQNCNVLAVLCGQVAVSSGGSGGDRERKRRRQSFPFPELVSVGRLDVHKIVNPTVDQFREAQRTVQPNLLYFQGEMLENEEAIGSLVWGKTDMSDPHVFSSSVNFPLPIIVYLEVPNSERIALALQAKGVPYIIYWKSTFSSYAASHFRQALFSVIQSSCSHTWDAFQLAQASFWLYCMQNSSAVLDNQKAGVKIAPRLLGEQPKRTIGLPEIDSMEEDGSSEASTVTIYDEDVKMRILVCGTSSIADSSFVSSLQDGLNALLNIEIRGCKLQNRVSAAPPPLQAGSFSRGFVTMRCDVTTCSSSYVSLLVSGSAQTCFDDMVLESRIKSELIEKNKVVCAVPDLEHKYSIEPLKSMSIAGGSSTFELSLTVPKWASQVLRHLSQEASYRSLVALGIAGINGTPVASFERRDADRLLFLCSTSSPQKESSRENVCLYHPPRWSAFATREERSQERLQSGVANGLTDTSATTSSSKARLKSAMRPIPRTSNRKMHPFLFPETSVHDAHQVKPSLPAAPTFKHNTVPVGPVTNKRSAPANHNQQSVPLNPLPMKKHGCNRLPIRECPEEDFVKDVMQFLLHRGHTRLVPQGGLSEFPDAILNAKRLDLYNLYKEVVSRGGFYVGNGINWKGQVFSKMRNHTASNRMTGVGNTLKRHYETYLLEYELAHDDVDRECCLLCHSSEPGDWVNCGLCGEWAHFGCDRRQGLGTFKDYAKTDGLEYVCPHCSLSNYKKSSNRATNGYVGTAAPLSRNV